jgi:hypothetical protein
MKHLDFLHKFHGVISLSFQKQQMHDKTSHRDKRVTLISTARFNIKIEEKKSISSICDKFSDKLLESHPVCVFLFCYFYSLLFCFLTHHVIEVPSAKVHRNNIREKHK